MNFDFSKDILTDKDISFLAQKLKIKLNQIAMKDEILNLKDGNYILNLQNHNQSGSHWTAFIKKGNKIYYCDSFGMPMPQEELNLFTDEKDIIYFNTTQIQDIESKCCGYFAIEFLLYFKINKGFNLNKFLNLFSLKKLKQNDAIVKDYIKNSLF